MTKFLLAILIALTSTACSKFDENTFAVVCDTKTEWYANINGVRGEEKSTESLTFVFKDKKLEGYECRTWTKEEIQCSQSLQGGNWSRNQVLNFDRLSGKFSSHKNQKDTQLKTTESKHWSGKCEKVKENKF